MLAKVVFITNGIPGRAVGRLHTGSTTNNWCARAAYPAGLWKFVVMRTLLSAVVLALLPVSHPFFLPARQAQLPRVAQRAQRVVLQEIEPDEYIPGLDVDVRLPLCEGL